MGRWTQTWKRGGREFGYLLPVACYPVLFVYFRNCGEAGFSQVWMPLAVFAGAAALCQAIFTWVARRGEAGTLAAQAAMLVIAFWKPLEDAIRDLVWTVRYWHLIPLALAGLLVLARVLGTTERSKTLSMRKKVAAVFAALIVYNALAALPTLWKQGWSASRARPAPEAPRPETTGDRPNVYFILLDEYASFPQMKTRFGEEPPEFGAFLERNGFSVSPDSYNPTFLTTEVLAGLVGMKPPPENARYRLAADGRIERYLSFPVGFEDIFAESALMRFFQDRGYTVYVASMLGDLFNVRSPLRADHAFQLSVDQRGISLENTVFAAVLGRSALEPLQYGLPRDPHYYNRMVEGIFDWIAETGNKRSPRFLWAHVACPHAPYLFERDGRWRREAGNPADPRHYLEQHRYATSRIAAVLEKLLENDPGSIILLQSDHGFRSGITLPVEEMAHIFNAVYYRGEALDVAGLSGLDTELFVINRLFGTDFPVIRGRRPLAGVEP